MAPAAVRRSIPGSEFRPHPSRNPDGTRPRHKRAGNPLKRVGIITKLETMLVNRRVNACQLTVKLPMISIWVSNNIGTIGRSASKGQRATIRCRYAPLTFPLKRDHLINAFLA